MQLPGIEGLLQVFQEQATKETGKHPDGQEEPRPAGDPPGAVRREAAAGDDAVQMGVQSQRLPPGMEHGEETMGGDLERLGLTILR